MSDTPNPPIHDKATTLEAIRVMKTSTIVKLLARHEGGNEAAELLLSMLEPLVGKDTIAEMRASTATTPETKERTEWLYVELDRRIAPRWNQNELLDLAIKAGEAWERSK